MTELGHAVLYARDLNRSVEFYTDIVGLSVRGHIFGAWAVMLSGGRTHHELVLIELGEVPGPLQGRRLGPYHIGGKIGNSLEVLCRKRDEIESLGWEIDGMSDHTVSQSLYLRDPDGNEIELYVDEPNIDWHADDAWMREPAKPLKL